MYVTTNNGGYKVTLGMWYMCITVTLIIFGVADIKANIEITEIDDVDYDL